MTPEEQVARVLAEHPDRWHDDLGWTCHCGQLSVTGYYDKYAAHLAAEVVKALGLYEYRSTGRLRGEGEVREHVMWRTPWQEVDA